MRYGVHIKRDTTWAFGAAFGSDPGYEQGVVVRFWKWTLLIGRVGIGWNV